MQQRWSSAGLERIFSLRNPRDGSIHHCMNARACSPPAPLSPCTRVGREGKEGTVYIVRYRHRIAAMKQFRPRKSMRRVHQEARMQRAAAVRKCAPKVYAVLSSPPRIVMELMSRTLPEVLHAQHGTLDVAQQESIVALCQRLDCAGIYQNDPNPLNLMQNSRGQFVWIDYGFAKGTNAKHCEPNLRSLQTLLWGGVQGVVARGMMSRSFAQGSILERASAAAAERCLRAEQQNGSRSPRLRRLRASAPGPAPP